MVFSIAPLPYIVLQQAIQIAAKMNYVNLITCYRHTSISFQIKHLLAYNLATKEMILLEQNWNIVHLSEQRNTHIDYPSRKNSKIKAPKGNSN